MLPLLAADPAVPLAEILAGIHELLGPDSPGSGHQHSHGDRQCGCGDADSAAPELDVRAISHAVRHAAVLGAFESIPTGGSLVLTAPHDPQRLLAQPPGRRPPRSHLPRTRTTVLAAPTHQSLTAPLPQLPRGPPRAVRLHMARNKSRRSGDAHRHRSARGLR